MLQKLCSRPKAQYWITVLDLCVYDFYPVLGWGSATSWEEHDSSQYQHRIKIGLPC